ncbi:MAG: Y-family DNA polymerase [Duodenibacillus sp.]
MADNLYALVDMNSFYASCEKLFRPDLTHTPVVVLSNNDGCVVARSSEAKTLGIGRGTPAFKLASLFAAADVEVFSSNYELYASLSARVFASIRSLVPAVEVYSIDECFALLTGMPQPLHTARQIRDRVRLWTGICCCVGIGPTKTLAKLANHYAKDHASTNGVFDWTALTASEQRRVLSDTPVQEVWGIGSRIAERLRAAGIDSALAFTQADAGWLRRTFGVTLERTRRELTGLECIAWEENPRPKQQICNSRSFAQPTAELDDIISAVSVHVAEAVRQLRAQSCLTGAVTVFFHTNAFSERMPQRAVWETQLLAHPTDDLIAITQAALLLVRRHFDGAFAYQKAGVVLSDMVPKGRDSGAQQTLDLWDETPIQMQRRQSLMQTIERINARFGRHTVTTASCRLSTGWRMRRDNLSPCYTTRIEDIPVVR